MKARHPNEATVIDTDTWSGVRGVSATGCYFEKGGYAGMCAASRLVISNDDGRVLILHGGPNSDRTFEMIFETFRFPDRR